MLGLPSALRFNNSKGLRDSGLQSRDYGLLSHDDMNTGMYIWDHGRTV